MDTERPSLVTLKEAASILRVSKQTLGRMVARGDLATVTVGERRKMIRLSAINEYLERKEGSK